MMNELLNNFNKKNNNIKTYLKSLININKSL